MRQLVFAHCNHCGLDKETRLAVDGLCVSCFIAGHRGKQCDGYCRTEPPQTDPRIAEALAIIYDVDMADSTEHKHEWSTRYVTFDQRYDCASGMKCNICGARLDQSSVEAWINSAQPEPDYDAEGYVIKT